MSSVDIKKSKIAGAISVSFFFLFCLIMILVLVFNIYDRIDFITLIMNFIAVLASIVLFNKSVLDFKGIDYQKVRKAPSFR